MLDARIGTDRGDETAPGGGFRPRGDAAGRLGEGLAAAGEIVSRSVRRSREEAGLRGQGGGSLEGAALLLSAADEARARAFLAAWTVLAAGERVGRAVAGPARNVGRPRRSGEARGLLSDVLSARTLALGTAALDLYTGYAALRERRRWFPGLVRGDDYGLQHRRGAGRALDAARALGATLIKAGQFASSRPDLLPPSYIRALSTLQDRVPPRPFGVIRRAIEEETGRPLYRTFFSIDPEPAAEFGAHVTALVTSAPSKTALGLVHALAGRDRVTTRGLTSAGNLSFVRGTGLYEAVTTYGAVEDAKAAPPAIEAERIERVGEARERRRPAGNAALRPRWMRGRRRRCRPTTDDRAPATVHCVHYWAPCRDGPELTVVGSVFSQERDPVHPSPVRRGKVRVRLQVPGPYQLVQAAVEVARGTVHTEALGRGQRVYGTARRRLP